MILAGDLVDVLAQIPRDRRVIIILELRQSWYRQVNGEYPESVEFIEKRERGGYVELCFKGQ